jgi:chemotaxis protein methyltransferase CheR
MNNRVFNKGLLELSDSEFYKFKELIFRESGIKLNEMKKALVQARLSKRIRKLGLGDYSDYYTYLIDNYDREKTEFINAITTNKTEFFRENQHFVYLREVFLPYLEKRGLDSNRIWSAGCSTGEEPYSLAITVYEYYKNREMPDVKILATDIDTDVLERAERGVYKKELLENIDDKIVRRYFLKGKGESVHLFQVKENLKNIIYFRKLNLQNDVYPMQKRFHIIFCRNVIIYFERESQKKLFLKFYRYLEDYGKLFIGHSENITSLDSGFHLEGNTIYSKNSNGAL